MTDEDKEAAQLWASLSETMQATLVMNRSSPAFGEEWVWAPSTRSANALQKRGLVETLRKDIGTKMRPTETGRRVLTHGRLQKRRTT